MKHKYPRSDFTGVNYLDLCSVLFFKHKNDVMCSSTQLAPSCGDIQNNLISPSGVCFVWIFKKCIIFGCNHECLNFLKRRLLFPQRRNSSGLIDLVWLAHYCSSVDYFWLCGGKSLDWTCRLQTRRSCSRSVCKISMMLCFVPDVCGFKLGCSESACDGRSLSRGSLKIIL